MNDSGSRQQALDANRQDEAYWCEAFSGRCMQKYIISVGYIEYDRTILDVIERNRLRSRFYRYSMCSGKSDRASVDLLVYKEA